MVVVLYASLRVLQLWCFSFSAWLQRHRSRRHRCRAGNGSERQLRLHTWSHSSLVVRSQPSPPLAPRCRRARRATELRQACLPSCRRVRLPPTRRCRRARRATELRQVRLPSCRRVRLPPTHRCRRARRAAELRQARLPSCRQAPLLLTHCCRQVCGAAELRRQAELPPWHDDQGQVGMRGDAPPPHCWSGSLAAAAVCRVVMRCLTDVPVTDGVVGYTAELVSAAASLADSSAAVLAAAKPHIAHCSSGTSTAV